MKEGLATIITNPRNDQISLYFSDLKKAKEIAKQSHKGLYTKTPPVKQCVTDCSRVGNNYHKNILYSQFPYFSIFK